MSDPGKFVFIFVAGIEGCGHHGLNPVISRAYEHHDPKATVLREWRKFKSACNRLWCKTHWLPFSRQLARKRLQRIFAAQARLAKQRGELRLLIEDNSFPAGKHRDLERQWRLDELYELVRPYADEVYFFGLYRHPIASVFSHKEWDGGLLPHARLMERFLRYVNEQLSRLDPALRRTVFYDDLTEEPAAFARQLADTLHLDVQDIEHGLDAVRKSRKDWRRDLPEQEQEQLRAIFADYQTAWPLLACAERATGAGFEH